LYQIAKGIVKEKEGKNGPFRGKIIRSFPDGKNAMLFGLYNQSPLYQASPVQNQEKRTLQRSPQT